MLLFPIESCSPLASGGALCGRGGNFGFQFQKLARIARRSAKHGRSHHNVEKAVDQIRTASIDRPFTYIFSIGVFLRFRHLYCQKATMAFRRGRRPGSRFCPWLCVIRNIKLNSIRNDASCVIILVHSVAVGLILKWCHLFYGRHFLLFLWITF